MPTSDVISELQRARAWCIDPGAVRGIVAAVESRAEAARYGRPARVAGGIGVLPLVGFIGWRSGLAQFLGGTNLDQWQSELRRLADSLEVGAIIVDVDSPGGTTDGVAESAEMLRGVQKPTIAVSNSYMASAAYWIGSAADMVLSLGSGHVGSIGAYAAHVSFAGANERQGVKVTLVGSSSQKTELSPDVDLTADARQALQERIDRAYAAFAGRVLKDKSYREPWQIEAAERQRFIRGVEASLKQ